MRMTNTETKVANAVGNEERGTRDPTGATPDSGRDLPDTHTNAAAANRRCSLSTGDAGNSFVARTRWMGWECPWKLEDSRDNVGGIAKQQQAWPPRSLN